jgi:hypothetical protein
MMTKTLAILAVLLLSTTAFAAGVDRRAARQDARIAHGAATGQLTARETVRLQARQQHIERTIARDRADGGGLSLRERRKIQRKENRLSRAIYREKHDAQVR